MVCVFRVFNQQLASRRAGRDLWGVHLPDGPRRASHFLRGESGQTSRQTAAPQVKREILR